MHDWASTLQRGVSLQGRCIYNVSVILRINCWMDVYPSLSSVLPALRKLWSGLRSSESFSWCPFGPGLWEGERVNRWQYKVSRKVSFPNQIWMLCGSMRKYTESYKGILELLLSAAVENEKELNVLTQTPKTLYKWIKARYKAVCDLILINTYYITRKNIWEHTQIIIMNYL